jgi:nitroreductase
MQAMELLLNRSSAVRLMGPGPPDEAIDKMIECAVRAPDHGRLRPWMFIVVREQMREQFGDVLAGHAKRRSPDATPEKLQAARQKAMRAPLIIVVVNKARPGDKIPRVEQLLSAGAAAQTILLAADALGYGAMWKTGSPAYDDEVKRELGLEPEDAIVGFLYIGTRVPEPPGRPALPRPVARDFVESWRDRQRQ